MVTRHDPVDDQPTRRQGGQVGAYFRGERREVPPPDGSDQPSSMVGRVAIDDHQRSAGGGLITAGLVTCIDSVGGFLSGLTVLPRWIVTSSLAVQVVRLDQLGPLRVEVRVLRKGRNSVVGAVNVVDEGAGDLEVATGMITSAVLDPRSMSLESERPAVIPMPPPVAEPVPLETFFGIEPGTGRTTRLLLDDRLRNPWGILHGGAVATLVDVAACRAVADGRAVPVATTAIDLHYLAPIRVGPVEARVSVLGRRPDGTVARVAVHDLGNGDRLSVVASVTVREL